MFEAKRKSPTTYCDMHSTAQLHVGASAELLSSVCRRRSGALKWLQFYWYYYCVHWYLAGRWTV